MILSDREIKKELQKESGLLGIEIDTHGLELYIGPSSIDLHLDNKAKIEKEDGSFGDHNDWDELIVYPGEFYVLSTVEKIKLGRQMAGFVHGRSSLAREGLNVHLAGFVDPGFEGNITLEVTNFKKNAIRLKKHLRICQLILMRTGTPVDISYPEKPDSKYQFQVGPTLSIPEK